MTSSVIDARQVFARRNDQAKAAAARRGVVQRAKIKAFFLTPAADDEPSDAESETK